MSLQSTGREQCNPRGIPKAVFIEQIDDYVGASDQDAELSLKTLQETLAKYRFMESNSLQRQNGLGEKIPELQRTIEMITLLQKKKEDSQLLETTFELSDTLYASGRIENFDEIYLWLGANTMLSYPLSSASSLLSAKLNSATSSMLAVREDLEWLRDQITVTEVNLARMYNSDVKRRRLRSQAQQQLG